MTERTITVTRGIPAPRAQVWAVLADFANIAAWNSGVKSSWAIGSTTAGVGARRHCDLAPAGGLDETVTVWDDERRLVVSIDKATVVPVAHAEVTFTLEDSKETDRTSATVTYRYAPKGGPLGRLLGPVLDRRLTDGFTGFLADVELAARAPSAA